MGVDSRHVVIQEGHTRSIGAGKLKVHGDSILVALALTLPVTSIQIPFILIRTGDVMTQSNTYGKIIKHLG